MVVGYKLECMAILSYKEAGHIFESKAKSLPIELGILQAIVIVFPWLFGQLDNTHKLLQIICGAKVSTVTFLVRVLHLHSQTLDLPEKIVTNTRAYFFLPSVVNKKDLKH